METKTFNGVTVPAGERITFTDGKPVVPANPIIPFIEGDGSGPDLWRATRRVLDAAVQQAYGASKQIAWYEVFAGEKGNKQYGGWLPDETVEAIRYFGVAIKGPLTTPTGGGFRSINVRLRQIFDLYSCERPVRYFPGVPSKVTRPEALDVMIFRENTEDVYAGIEFQAGSPEMKALRALLATWGHDVPEDAGLGIKPISREKTRRLVRRAIQFAIKSGRNRVTLVHKGNIQKFTEGAFCEWGMELAREEFADVVIFDDELWSNKHNGKIPAGKVHVNDLIADAALHNLTVTPDAFSVIATTNLNGDYISDDCAGLVGGLGIAPGANIGEHFAIFEATHGTAWRLANQDKANPGSLILSGAMMLEFLGWKEAADLVVNSFAKTIASHVVTNDMAVGDVKGVKTSEFANAVIANMAPPAVTAPAETVVAEPVAAGTDGDSGSKS